MRVLLVSQEMPPETAWGGIGTYVDILSEALVRAGCEAHVLSVTEQEPSGVRRTDAGVWVHGHRLPPLRDAFRLAPLQRPLVLPPEAARRLWVAWWVGRAVPRLPFQPDVVECPEWMAEGLFLGLRGALPLVVRLHSAARQLFPYTGQGRTYHGRDGRLAAHLEEISARRAHAVISTRSNLEEVAGWMRLDPAALHAIPYPVRPAEPAPPPEGPPRVTFLGRLEPRKGPEQLLGAAPHVLTRVPEARFAFVGRDAVAPGARCSSAWLRAEAMRLGVSEHVELTGQLDREGVREQLRQATLCAFPSRWESFGNVVAEAASAGRPVVVSSIPAFRDLVQEDETGLVVPLDDSAAWGAAIAGLLEDRELCWRMGKAGARRIAALSDPQRVAELTLDAYEAGIARWRSGRRTGTKPRGRRRASTPRL